MMKRVRPQLWKVLPVLFVLGLFGFLAHPAYAGNAPSSDVLVQCDSSGVVTNNTVVSSVYLPIAADTSGNFYLTSVDAAVYSGSESNFDTFVTEQDGFSSTRLQIGLGAVTHYDSGTIYEIEFRGHYGVVGSAAQNITEDWQDSGLYFEPVLPLSSDATLASLLGQAISATGGTGSSTSDPKLATINVANSDSSVASGNIVADDSNATVTFYGTDSSFTTPETGSVSLTAGGETSVYIKVVPQDTTTTLYYEVTIDRAASLSSARDILTFSVAGQVGSSLIDTASHTVTFYMPSGTSVNSLAPVITVSSSATVSPASGTAGNFTNPVTYTVTAQDSSTQNWTVTCTVQQPGSPVLQGITPSSGLAGANVTLSGSNFGSVAGAVYFTQSGSQHVVAGSSWSDSGAQATVPMSLSPGSVSVAVYNVASGLSNPLTFTVTTQTQHPAAPTISPGTGTYSSAQTVTIGNIPTGDTAYYTTGSTGPTLSSTPYTGAFTVSRTETVTAGVYDTAGGWSSFTSATFTISTSSSSGGGGTSHPVNNTGTATLTPATGGTVSLGSDVSVTIPKGVLAGDTSVAVAVTEDPSPPAAPSGFMLLGSVYQFTVGGASHYTFGGAVTIAISFDPAKLPAGQAPTVYYYDDAKGQWVDIGGTVNWTNDTITVSVNHFTEFAVLATKSAESTATASTSTTFSDVSTSYWAYSAIGSLSSRGIVSGYPDGSFKPSAKITRAEFAAMLVKALGLNVGTTGSFTDVASGDWCYSSVNAAVYAGLVSGMGDHLFAPGALITREQMAVMVAKALGSKAPAVTGTELNAFSDRPDVSSWAITGMEEAVKAGIVSGTTANTLAPLANATRAQAAAMVYKLLSVLGK